MSETDDRIRELEAQKAAYEQQMANYESYGADADEQVTRLQAAYDELDNIKESVKAIFDYICDGIAGEVEQGENLWEGNAKSKFLEDTQNYYDDEDTTYLSLSNYIDEIDAVQDDINTKINQLQEDQGEWYEFWVHAKNGWDDVCTSLENFFN